MQFKNIRIIIRLLKMEINSHLLNYEFQVINSLFY